MLKPKISVIIPIYNVEKYVEECLNSIVNQTLKDIEIICINDGSTDNSLQIVEKYAKKDKRFVIFSQENQGQGIARNKGLELANGEYILFVDSDDWIKLNSCEVIYNYFKETNAEVIQFNYTEYKEFSGEQKHINLAERISKKHQIDLNKAQYYSYKNVKKNCMVELDLMVWTRAYSRNFIENSGAFFAPTKIGEDSVFANIVLLNAHRIYYLNQYLYLYRRRDGSSTYSFNKKDFDVFKNIAYLEKYLKERNFYNEIKEEFSHYKLREITAHYKLIHNEKIDEYKKIAKNYLTENEYNQFLINTYNKMNFLEFIFSIRNLWKKDTKIKVITIFGFKFFIKLENKKNFEEKIDLVYLWCDTNDETWLKKKKEYFKSINCEENAKNDCRFINNEELKYSLRSVEQYMPWVNHIYIVSDAQIPSWLNLNNPKISMVFHKDIMPAEALPCFNSMAIEHCIKNIPNLSEFFLIANDDMFVNDFINPTFFYKGNGKKIIYRVDKKIKKINSMFVIFLKNASDLLNKKYMYYPHHNIDAYKKSLVIKCYKQFKDEIDKTIMSHHRTLSDISRTIYSNYACVINDGILKKNRKVNTDLNIFEQGFRFLIKKYCKDSLYLSCSDKDYLKTINKYKPKLFCINDDEETTSKDRERLKEFLNFYFFQKSDFEY